MYEDITPARTISETWRWFPAAVVVLAALLLLGGLATIVCWQAGWWFASHDVNRQNQLYQDSRGVQQSDTDQMESDIQAISTRGLLPAQQAADARDACKWAARITVIPPGDKSWTDANCVAGGLAPGSTYN